MAIVQATITAYPSSLDTVNSVYDRIDDSYPISNAFAASSSTTQARVYWVKGSSAQTYVYLKFDLSSIPADATILSVGCSEKTNMTGTQSSRWSERDIYVTSGTTIKSGKMGTFDTSAHTFGDAGTWTWAELQEARMRYHIKRGTNSSYYNTDYYLAIYGATLTVTYEYDSGGADMPVRVKDGGSWVTPSKVLVKDGGVWKEATKILAKDGGIWH